MEDIIKTNFIKCLQKQVDEDNFSQKITRGLFDYYGIVPKEKKKKIYIEVIFNFKIFYIKFCFMKLTTTKIFPSSQGIKQRWILNSFKYDTFKSSSIKDISINKFSNIDTFHF